MSNFLGINTNSVPAPASNADPLAQLYASPASLVTPRWKDTPLGQFAVKLGWGCLCSVLIGCVKGMPFIIKGIRWACHITLLILGMPDGAEKLKDKLAPIVEQGRAVAKEHKHDGLIARTVETVKKKAASEVVKTAVKTATDTAEKKLEPVKKKAEEVVDTAKETGEKIIGAINGRPMPPSRSIDNPPAGEGGGMGYIPQPIVPQSQRGVRGAFNRFTTGITEYALAKQKMEEEERKRIEADRPRLAAWWKLHGPNAQCPRCHRPLRFGSGQNGDRGCNRCGAFFTARRAKGLGPPRNFDPRTWGFKPGA